MKDVTSISIDSYATTSDTYTILTNGVYDVCVTPKHHGDSCPGGTGRYGANLLINGESVDSYSGNASAKKKSEMYAILDSRFCDFSTGT